jgi:hypothetical protein
LVEESEKVSVAVNCTVLPGETFVIDGLVGLSAMEERVGGATAFTPITVSPMLCGELDAVSVRVMESVSVPVVVGFATTKIEQVFPCVIGIPVQVWVWMVKFVPVVRATDETITGAVPVLVQVAVSLPEVVPTTMLPKFGSVAGHERIAALNPVPVRLTVCVPIESVTVTVADSALV